ncbi:hypothetical protein ACEWY4_010262 [Coilia grayii]|uniref:CxC7-like cysteine cluster associated with KDZ transposases domain-containing protein n=1 Tax=Coilia grayii TaxID=363190 RepID=A0ABD1K1E0_9TELE
MSRHFKRHGQHFGQRFAFWTEEAKQLLGGTLPPLFKVPQPRQQQVQVEPIEEEPLQSVVVDMYQAHSIIVNNPGLFTGKVREPPYLQMDQEDKANADWHGRYTMAWDAMEPFSFIFERPSDAELPDDIISRIFVLVVQDGDPAILNLALTCQKFHSIACQPLFLEEAHFSWLDSVVEWKSLPPQHRDKYRRPYTISQCHYLLCGGLYKDCGAGYKGNGQRGVLQGFYSTEDYPGYCSWDCFINDGGLD